MSNVLNELEEARKKVAELERKAAEELKAEAAEILGRAAAVIAQNDAGFRATILENLAKYSGVLKPDEVQKVKLAFGVEVKQKRAYNRKPKSE